MIVEDDEVPGHLVIARVLAPIGWTLAAIGYFGPWIAHETAALTLSGVDMGEFVKFLPSVVDGSLQVVRQLFYLPPVAVAFGIATLACSRRLHYPRILQVFVLALAIPVSLQLLPPAWSPFTLMSPEFRLQTMAVAILWLLLAGACIWARLRLRWLAVLNACVALAAAVLSAWQFKLAKPAIDGVYSTNTSTGWGFFLCVAGLAVMATAAVLSTLKGPRMGQAQE
jgi:hypothetical protein